MDRITRNLVNKKVLNQKLIITAFTTLPNELQLEILDYIPIKIVFQPNELEFYKNHLLFQNDFKIIHDSLRWIFYFMNNLIERNHESN